MKGGIIPTSDNGEKYSLVSDIFFFIYHIKNLIQQLFDKNHLEKTT